MGVFSEILKRDAKIAAEEAAEGKTEAIYWAILFSGFLRLGDSRTNPERTFIEPRSGAEYFKFTDPDTGIIYDVRVKPRRKQQKENNELTNDNI